MLINAHTQTLHYKIVYFGAALSGKTTNVRYIAHQAHNIASAQQRVGSKLVSLATRGERTLYFDHTQLTFGTFAGYRTHFSIYSTPGQDAYTPQRQLVLKGADVVVFVVDSQFSRQRDNRQAFDTLRRLLYEQGRGQLPIVLQLNKRDMPYIETTENLLMNLGASQHPYVEANASHGDGVMATFECALQQVLAATRHLFKLA